LDVVLAAVFAFLAVGSASAAVSAVAAGGVDRPSLASAGIATALVFGAFAIWTFRGAP
jgi:hypothetical protein